MEWHRDEWNDNLLKKHITRKLTASLKNKGFVFITAALKNKFEEDFPNHGLRLIVMPDAANDPLPCLVTDVFLKTDLPSIGYVGSFQPGKGLEIIRELIPMMPNVFFHIIGGSNDQVQYERERCKNFNNVYFYGYTPKNETDSFIAGFDICLLPNLPSVKTGRKGDIGRYTSPLKMFEYMSHGKPIVASNLDVLKEILNESNSVLVDFNKIELWKDAINNLLNDRGKMSRIGQKAREDFLSLYTWDKRAKYFLNL